MITAILLMFSLGFSIVFAIVLAQFILKISQFTEIYKEFGHKKSFFVLFCLYFLILILIFSFLRYNNENMIKEKKNKSEIEQELRKKIKKQIDGINKKIDEHNFEMKFGRKKTEQEKMIEEKIKKEKEKEVKKAMEENKKRLEKFKKKAMEEALQKKF